MKSFAKQLVLNTLSGWGSVLARSALSFIMVPFLLRQLGQSGFGIVGLLMVLHSFAEVADLGLRQALSRELAEQAARHNHKGFNELASTGFLLCLLIGCTVATACVILAPALITFFNVPEPLRPMAIQAIRIYGTGAFLLSFASAAFPAAIISVNRFDLRNHIEAGCRIVTGITLLVVLSNVENGLMGWVFVTLAGQGLTLLLYVAAAHKTTPWLQLSWKHVHRESAASLLHFGWKVYVLQLTNLVAERSDPLVISRFFGPAGVALYTPGGQLAGLVRPILLTLSAQLAPLATRQHVENALQKQQQMLIEGTRFTLLIGSLFCVGLLVFADPFCALWLGNELGTSYRTVATVIQLWAVADFFACTASMQWPMMLGARKLNTMMIIHGTTALLNICLSIYFVGFTTLGIIGALLGTVLTNAVLRPLLVAYSLKVFQIPFIAFYRAAILRPMLTTALLLPITYAIRHSMPTDGYFHLISCATLTGTVWIVLAALIGVSRQERQLFWSQISKHFASQCS